MTEVFQPQTAMQLGDRLREASSKREIVETGGAFSKLRMGGPRPRAALTISTSAMNGVLAYEPNDLTISVGAGMKFSALETLLAGHKSMLPLNPPFREVATIGGVLATNSSGPWRRGYGTIRDHVIGMEFVTMDGKLVKTGGMVVKNVAGLDFAKLMIGSFGTLAVVTSVNFKLTPAPEQTQSFLYQSDKLEDVLKVRDRLLGGVLHPPAIDILNPAAARQIGLDGWSLLVEVFGGEAVLARWKRDFADAQIIDGAYWEAIREFAPRFCKTNSPGCVCRTSTTLSELGALLSEVTVPVVSRAGNGVTYLFCTDEPNWPKTGKSVMEFRPETADVKPEAQWPQPGSDLELMKKVKAMFDPSGLLNPGRLYGRI